MKLLNNTQKLILIGSLLGDANLQTFTNGKSWRIRFIQGDCHKEYLFHLYSIFASVVNTPPKSITDKYGNTLWYFNTLVISNIDPIPSLFYRKKGSKWIKFISPDLVSLLEPISLSYWFMDDGSLKQVKTTKGFILCTDSFHFHELKYLDSFFRKKHGIYISYHKQRENYRIYIPTRYFGKFRTLIKPWIHSSMIYKLG